MQPPSIVILTGAGISAESGLATFRNNNGQNTGLWCNHRIEDVATPEAFIRNPSLVHDFYNQRRRQLKEAHPNAAHHALAALANAYRGRVMIVTQNVDDLHDRADDGLRLTDHKILTGFSSSVICHPSSIIHMHGELKKVRCERCNTVHHWEDDLFVDTPCPACSKPDPGLRRGDGHMRPHIVWFGEMPLYMEEIEEALADCDLFISIGTSGNVYPAAGFVRMARSNGKAHTVELNMEPSQGHSMFHERIYGPATKIVPEYVSKLLMKDE